MAREIVKIAQLADTDVDKVFQTTDNAFPGESRAKLYEHFAFCERRDKKFLHAVQLVQKTFGIQVC